MWLDFAILEFVYDKWELASFFTASLLVSVIKCECEVFVVDHQVKCSNMKLKEGEALRNVAGGTVSYLFLENIEGVVDGTTLKNYPKLIGLTILSSKVESTNSVRNLPHIDRLEFQNCELPRISEEFLNNCCSNTNSLELTRIKSMEIEYGAMKKLSNLRELTIDDYKTINDVAFEGLNFLQKVFLMRVDLKRLTKKLLQDMTRLNSLSIVSSNLAEIDEDAFENNPEMKFFWASDNKLTEIKPRTFKSLKRLEFLNLMGNDIKDFNLNLLSEQKEIKILRLDTKNMLQMNAGEMKKALPKLERIGLCLDDRFKPEIQEFVGILNVCVTWRDDKDSYIEIGSREDCS